MGWWDRLRGWLGGEPEPTAVERPRPRPAPKRRRPLYTGAGSGTRDRILRILADGKPRTRLMISAELDVKTAGIHLPRMVDEGLLRAEYLSRRLWYSLAPPQAEAAVDPSDGNTGKPTTREGD
jgi:hypothetical protein